METAGIWMADTLDEEGDVYGSVTCVTCGDCASVWLDAEDRARLIEFLQRFPLPPTGQETDDANRRNTG